MSSFSRRVIICSAQDELLFELGPRDLFKLNMVEEINAEHSLTIVSTRNLEKEQRVLTQDETGKWHEFVVMGNTKSRGGNPYKEYRCVWSLQHDLKLFGVDEYYDEEDAITAGMALRGILSNTTRWSVGTVTVTTIAGADMTQTDGWTALSKLIGSWGGEVDAVITVGNGGVTSRRVNLVAQVGEPVARRRFDYSKDLTQISRKVDESPIACRVRPYGKSENTIDDIKVKLTIEDVNGGLDYIQNDDVAAWMRFPDGSGGYEYPTINIENSSIDDDELLLEWAESVLLEYTTPTITYEATVLQYEEAGTSAMGLALGDAVQCVDKEFFDGQPLRLESRVRRIERDLLDKRRTIIKIGNPKESLTSSISGAVNKMSDVVDTLTNAFTTTSEFIANLLGNLNDDINATGGYAYVTDGEGIVTYDIAVDDPLIGFNSDSQTWASRVVQIKGGSIRIADTKRSGFSGINDWEWKTVFVSGHIASELVTAANIVAGFIGSPNGGNYWNLDTGELRIVPTALIGEKTFSELIQEIDATITSVDVQYAQNQSSTVPPESGWSTTAPVWQSGYYIWQRTATTAADGISYSSPVCISGREGRDGTSVTILGSYNSLAELQAAHPSGNVGDGYTVSGDLYVWNGSAWENVGTIQGPAGTNGANGYVHIAWANSADGSVDFSTSTAADRSYVGMYTDNNQTASQQYVDYAWSKIKGADGDDGVGIVSIVEQYYLSTSNSTQTGDSWSTTQPAWQTGRYIWTRSEITWDTTPATVTHTTPILAQALTQANELAKTAKEEADTVGTSLTNLQTQQAIFNLLTNNGTLEGLYMQNNNLYINADYIASGYLGDVSGKSYWNISDGTLVIVNANKNFNNRYEQFKFGSITFTDSSGWLNTRTGQQTANGIMVGDTSDSNVSGRSRVYIIPNLPATSSDSNSSTESVIISRDALKIMSEYDGSTTRGCISMNSGYVEINQVSGSTVRPGVLIGSSGTYIDAKRSDYSLNNGNTSTTITSAAYFSNTYGIWLYKGAHFNGGFDCQANASVGINDSSKYKRFNVYGSATIWSGLSVYGTKSRVASTDNYSDRLLYSYETPVPLFGDVGSGVIGDDGTCVVSIDDIFQETVRTDMAYQVFLQKCGRGDLWVSDKKASYFVVEGTPNIAFDWEIKCRQKGFETERLEDRNLRDESDEMGLLDIGVFAGYEGALVNDEDNPYAEELEYVESMERMYHDEIIMEEQ